MMLSNHEKKLYFSDGCNIVMEIMLRNAFEILQT